MMPSQSREWASWSCVGSQGEGRPQGEVMITLPSAMHCSLLLSCRRKVSKWLNPIWPRLFKHIQKPGWRGTLCPPLNILGLGGVRAPNFFSLPFSKLTIRKVNFFNKLVGEFAQIYTNTCLGPNRVKWWNSDHSTLKNLDHSRLGASVDLRRTFDLVAKVWK